MSRYIDEEYVVKEIDKNNFFLHNRIYVYGQVGSYLKPFDGKLVNKRIITHLKKHLPDFSFALTEKTLQIWGQDIEMRNRLYVHLEDFMKNGRLDYNTLANYCRSKVTELSESIVKMENIKSLLPSFAKEYDRCVDQLKHLEGRIGETSKALRFFPIVYEVHKHH